MTTIRDRLLQMRTEIDQILGEMTDVPRPPVPASRFMSVPQFATSRGFNARTVRDYCDLGMPHVGEGKGRRILVAEAVAWLENGGPKRARMARKENAA